MQLPSRCPLSSAVWDIGAFAARSVLVVSRVLRTILSGQKRQRGWRAETERTIDSIVSVMTPAPGVTDRRKHGLPFSVVRHSLLALPRS